MSAYSASPTGARVDESIVAAGSVSHIHRRISWQAILAGVVVTAALQILLSLLGAGIGLGMVNTNAAATPDAGSYGIGAGLWWLVSNLIALAAGGYVAAWLAGISLRFDGMLHGIITWGLVTLLTLYLLTSAVGGLIGGAMHVAGSTLSAAGSTVSSAAPKVAEAAGLSPDLIQQQAQSYLQPTNPDVATMSPQDAQKAIASELPTYMAGGANAGPAKDRIVSIMAAQMHVSRDDAAKRFDETQAKLTRAKDQTVQTAKTTADTSASAASKGAFLAFVTFLLGAIAAALGGSAATQRRVLVTEGAAIRHTGV